MKTISVFDKQATLLLQNLKIDKEDFQQAILSYLRERWSECVTPPLVDHCEPLKIRSDGHGNILIIGTEHSIWSQEIMSIERDIIFNINQLVALSGMIVAKIKCQMRFQTTIKQTFSETERAEEQKTIDESIKDEIGQKQTLPEEEKGLEEMKGLLEAIKDPILKELMEKMSKYIVKE